MNPPSRGRRDSDGLRGRDLQVFLATTRKLRDFASPFRLSRTAQPGETSLPQVLPARAAFASRTVHWSLRR